MTKVNIITYGCSNNAAESQIMANTLQESGFSMADFDAADIVIVNTCSVKSVTENKIIHQLREINNNYPEKGLIVTGCMPEAEYEIIKEVAPNASLLSTHKINEVGELASAVARGEYMEIMGKARLDKALLPRQRANTAIDIVPISSGCKSFCTFCSTKIAKGDLFSFPEESIIESVRRSVSEGVREFWLTSQDNGCYGFDRGTNLAELILKITSEVEGDYMLRVGMMNPEHVKKLLPDLVEAYRSSRVFKFVHLPVQSGSDAILTKMHRRYTVSEFMSMVDAFRGEIPGITVWTDMIAGFPGETDEDFEASIKMLQKLKPDFANVSAYGNRPKTAAFRMKQVDTQVKKQRTAEMSAIVREIAREKNEKWIGWRGTATVDEYNATRGTWIARNYAYKQIVLKGMFALGEKIPVRITGASRNALFCDAVPGRALHDSGLVVLN